MNGNNGKPSGETQIQVAIGMLIYSVSDKSPVVLETLMCSLRKISEKHPNQILRSCCQYCTKTPKPSSDYIASVLKIMERVCSDHITNIDGDVVLITCEVSLKIMTDDNVPESVVQQPASQVLVALGRVHFVQVMDELIKRLSSETVPHFMIPYTLGALANANAIKVVPYLKDIFRILTTFLPFFNDNTFDSSKQSYAFAIRSFCDSVVEYVSNNEKVPDSTITADTFNVEIGRAFKVFFNVWLQSRDSKVVESVLDALASLYTILSTDEVTQYTTKVIQVLLGLYKKNIDAYYVTKCLLAVLKKSTTVDGTLLEPFLINIFNTLFDLVCISPDYAQPSLVKSHSEVLRCYECFALHFTDSTVDHLLVQLKNNNDNDRVRSLLVITHLVSYSGEQAINRRYKDIMHHLNDLLNDSNIRVKKALVKIIVAFSTNKVLLKEEINPDGPEKYMEFILKMCCKQVLPKNTRIDSQELTNIQKSSDNTLYMLCTSVPELELILWELLLKYLLGPMYDEAIVIILRCLTHLASKKVKAECCQIAFIRCLALLANPLPEFKGCFILNFLKNIKPCETDSYKTVWDTKIPQLTKYLEQNYENFNSLEWRDLLFDFLNILLENVDNQTFNEIIVFEARKQLNTYYNRNISSNIGDTSTAKVAEKHVLLKCLAIAVCHLKNKETVLLTLDHIISNVKLTDYTELCTCAEAIGICSRTHMRVVLDKLALIRKEVFTKKSKFFSFIKDQKHDMEIERLRYTVIQCYAEISNEAPAEKLLQIIESEILEYVISEFNNSKDFTLKKACLKATRSIADAMQPNRNSLHIRMNEKDTVIKLLSSQMQLHKGPEFIELFPLIISTITALVRLPLPIESEDRIQIQKLFFDNVFNASAIYCKINAGNQTNYYGDLKLVPYVTQSFQELNQFVQEILRQHTSPATLDESMTLLEPWLGKKKQEQRLPAIETLRIALHTYLDDMRFAYECPSTFSQTGLLLAKIVPRCTDPNKNIRKIAVECLCLVLCIAARYEGHSRDHDKQLTNSLQHIQQKIESDDPKLLYHLTSDMAHVICLNLPHFQLSHFIDGLTDALLDCESSSSNGSSVVLNATLKNKGGELQNHVPLVFEKILRQLYNIPCQRTKSSTIRSVLNIAMHHPKIICGILLSQPLPYDSVVCDCWSVLTTDSTLAQDLLDQLKKHVKSTALYEEHGDGTVKVATLQPMQAICALHEMFKNAQLKELCLQQFPEYFSILFICMASYRSAIAPAVQKTDKKSEKYSSIISRDIYKLSPIQLIIETFRLFLTCCQFERMATSMLLISDTSTFNEQLDSLLEVIDALVENVCLENSQSLSWLVACLGPSIRADLEPQRVATIAFFTSLIRQGANEQSVLTENLLEMILDVQSDTSCDVRRIALKGLGYTAEYLSFELVSRHCNSILSVLMNSLDYNNIGNESAVVVEGMLSFSKLLTALEGCKFSSFQVTAAVRIKPLLDQEDVNLRRASFHLLGDLTNSLNSEANLEAFREQIQGNLITLFLHLCDPDIYVVKASKYTLRKIGPYLDSPKVNAMIQEHLIEEANLHFTDFIRDLIKVMADELEDLFPLLIMTCLSYLKSQWLEIKGNAALIAGLLYSQLSKENKSRVSLDTVCDRLTRILHDDNEEVRMKSIEAISYLLLN